MPDYERPYGGEVHSPVRDNALYAHALACLQQGDWAQANELLGALQQMHPAAGEVQALQQLLALRLSTEKNWAASSRRSLAAVLEAPLVRALAIAAAALYTLLGVIWLLARLVAGAG